MENKPILAQKLALKLGRDGGPNSYYLDPKHKKYNRNVYTEDRVQMAIGSIDFCHLPAVIRARKKKKK